MFRHSNTTARLRATRASQFVVVSLAVLFAALVGTAQTATPPVDLGTLGGTSSFAVAVNDSGQVVGASFTPGDVAQHAFSWTAAGGMVDLGTLGGTFSSAVAVNDSGQVVGDRLTAGDGAFHAFSWTTAGGMVDLGTLGGSSSQVFAVNASGQVVGSSRTVDAETHAFSWTPAGGMVDLGTLGGSFSHASGVNASGQVIGDSYTDGGSHAFSWTAASGMIDLTLGGNFSEPLGMTDSGQVIGFSTTAGEAETRVFSWTAAGGIVDLDLGTLGGSGIGASGINNTGILVGASELADGTVHATLWQLPRPPACGMARPDVPVLWPPNHKFVPIHILGISDPDNHPLTITVTGVTENEPVNGPGDGNTSPDALLGENGIVLLRAERAGGGNGRVYRVQFRADDGLGGVCTGSVSVVVPKSMKSGRGRH
jgi:probable HAF family extracellular repeat protein